MNKRLPFAGFGFMVAMMVLVALLAQSSVTSHASSMPLAQAPTRERAVIDQYCIGCHNQRIKSGGLSLDDLDLSRIGEHAAAGEKIVRKMRAGMMPPSGSRRPDAATYEFVAGSLERQLDIAAAKAPNFAPPGVHRLNRREYANAVRDLLALEVDPSTLLPVDDSSYGFDNMAGTLGTSPALVEAYVTAAAKISRLALGHEVATVQKSYLTAPDYSQNGHVEGLPFGTRGGLLVQHYFPADGVYAFNWTPVRANAGGIFGDPAGEQLELTIDGERIKVWPVDKEAPRNAADTRFEIRVPVKAGMRAVGLAFLNRAHVPSDDINRHYERTSLTQNLTGFTFAPHVNALFVTGPFEGKRPEHTASRDRIFVCRPASAAEETSCAKTVLSTLARKAYRRPVNDQDTEILMSLYQSARSNGNGGNAGDFEDGIERGLQMILADPGFIYRTESIPATAPRAGQSYPLSDLELASRLSFFLWSSVPDDELLNIASQGKLRNTGVIEKQVKRMLADSRSKEFVSNFAGQWLQLRNLQSVSPVGDLFPDFDDNLRQAFRTETEMFFESIVREDRNVVDLLNADYTFVNERLAKHYGIPNVYGGQFRRIQLGPEFDVRRGLLGQGSILTVTSAPDRTSPVRRGKWVVLNILGVVPPDPPPNVPVLKESDVNTGARKVVTMRQRMEEHRSPACASCHKMMDPIGFAMENFDAIGRYRTVEGVQKLDLSGELVDGAKFVGSSELRREVLRYSPRFVETLTERLLSYALGRGVEYYDMPVVRRVVREAAARNNRFSELVLGIVDSQPFQRNQFASEGLAGNRN